MLFHRIHDFEKSEKKHRNKNIARTLLSTDIHKTVDALLGCNMNLLLAKLNIQSFEVKTSESDRNYATLA